MTLSKDILFPDNQTQPEPALDIATELETLRQQIKLRREKLHGSDLAEIRALVRQVNETWNVSAHLPITWGNPPVIGRGIAYAKRATRLLLRWYINPIIEQQNNFNAAVTRSLLQINSYLEQLTREDYQLQLQLAALEEKLQASANPSASLENS